MLKSLPLITNFYQMAPLSYTITHITNCTTFVYLKDIRQNNQIPMIANFFSGTCISRCFFCQNLAPFCTLSSSHYLVHFAADFVTLS